MTQICCFPKDSVVRLGGPEIEADRRNGAADDHGSFRPLAVEHPSPDLRQDDEADEEVQEEDARARGRVVQRDLGVLTGEEEDGDERHHGDEEHDVLDGKGADAEDVDLDER